MGALKTLRLLLDLRQAWKSKTLTLGRILAWIPTLDLAFFQGDFGLILVTKLTAILNAIPVLPDFSIAQVTSFLIVVVGGLVVELRKRTDQPLENRT